MHFERTADNDTVSAYQVSSVQLVTNKKLEACITLRACDHWAVTALLFQQMLDLVHLRQPPLIHE